MSAVREGLASTSEEDQQHYMWTEAADGGLRLKEKKMTKFTIGTYRNE